MIFILLQIFDLDLCFSSYDETDEDCLSPNLDDVTNTEVIEDSSVEESTLSEGSIVMACRKDPLGIVNKAAPSSGFVNLSTIYSLGNNDRINNQNKNPIPERKGEKPIPPEKPVSLMMMNGKMDNKFGFGNNSFLYSQLLNTNSGAKSKDPPSYTAATSDKEAKKIVTSPNKTVKTPTSPVNGVSKISDNYERAVAERLSPQREISRVNRSSLFSKVNTGIVSEKVKKNNRQEDDEDYARDSDECSI